MKEDEDDATHLEFNWEKYKWINEADFAVIFNLNGVLIENRELNKNAWKWILEQLRINNYSGKKLNSLMSRGYETKYIMNEIFHKSRHLGDTPISEMLVNSWSKIKRDKYIENLFNRESDEMPGAGKLIEALNSNHIKVGLYSIFERKSVIKILNHTGYKQFFNAVVTPESIRPEYEGQDQMHYMGILNEVKARLNNEQNNFFLLEDSIDIVGWASGHGMKCIGFGLENGKELKKKGAICVVDDHTELVNIFKNSQKSDIVVKKLVELDMRQKKEKLYK